MFLENGFNMILKTQGVECTITDVPKANTATIKMAVANASRKLEFINDTTYAGKELVVSKRDLDANSYPRPRVGDKISSSIIDGGYVSEVNDQIAMGVVIGYRLKLS